MKKLIPLTLAVLAIIAFPNVSEAAKGNIPIPPYQIVQTIAQAIQSEKEPIYNSKPVATPASKKKRTGSRSSRRPSLAAASNQSSAVVSTPAEPSQAAGSPSAQFAGVSSSTTVSEPAAVSAAPSKPPVGNVNESPTQAASIAAASTPASSNAAETATAALDSAPAATPPPRRSAGRKSMLSNNPAGPAGERSGFHGEVKRPPPSPQPLHLCSQNVCFSSKTHPRLRSALVIHAAQHAVAAVQIQRCVDWLFHQV